MRRLTLLTLVAGSLLTAPLHGEEAAPQEERTLSFPSLVPDNSPASGQGAGDSAPAAPAAAEAATSAPAAAANGEPPATGTAAPAAGAGSTADTPVTPAPAASDASAAPPDAPPALPPVSDSAAEPAAAGLAPTVVSSLTFAQMGMPKGVQLSGGQLLGGANFTLPGDQVVTSAQLRLDVKVTPEMAARNATLELMLNGQSLGSVPLGAEGDDVSHYQLDVPGPLMVSSNNLSFRINDGDAQQCMRDLTNRYGVTILPESRFSWEGQQLDVGADLSHFPRPFFDNMQMTPASISISFPEKMSSEEVSAAALVSSWFGIQTDYRGISFNALRNKLPEKHGIVIGHPGEQVGELTLPQTSKPLLRIVDNPNNPVYKLLLIVGSDDNALRAAAWRLTRGDFAPQAGSLEVAAQTVPLSKPYDAPRWITTDRPVKISELLRKDQSMTVSGVWHEPLRVAFRAAPDLYLWDGESIPLQISYRFPSESWINEQRSQLSVTLNNTFLRNLPMIKQGILESLWRRLGGDARQEKLTIPLAPYLIYGDNQLQLYFNVVPKDNAPCNVLLNNNIKSRIAEDSWIDLSHTRHFSMLPNLSYFVGASFPFSRLADYSQTLLLLPDRPSETEVGTLLNMAARSGTATGTVLGNNRVVMGIPSGGASLEYLRQRDVLAVSGLDQKLFNQSLLDDSPYYVSDSTLSVRNQTLWQKAQRWLLGDWNIDALEADRYLSSNNAWRGFISYRSPWNSERVVVVALGSSDEQLGHLNGDLSSARINASIRGDTAIITNDNVRSFQVAPQFPSGQMPWYQMVIWYANQHSGFLAILALLMTSIIGLALTAMFKQHAHKRLNPGDDE
ncbi:cellulose biosynthesis cyclic di-GMP-binding regulatory protein BcsB [Pluralibacter gergoviae]|uniref:Cyclic di-GMP-binding protein n=1 Tax=Pluralibacter gergoviae TaxID=61647 RepID=A0AAW8HUM9_PLUGE|nr:cellulose biosynthesis cyclic di-GMP-binding regulatory protein BcsB [Pluralibacter gergoviae]AVR01741.1 cellulose biosynthesis cyclic di-GMP-binding regulatory protein BcsB [Pluralibacter gergoviae]KMK01705.1 cellulose synthase [Pluralibacter gergoviae]MDQ2312316.1 cellulose biosynthesis cyclic di-GMP-binding regulatory protein BcsB [Pluralibacter gergoviae]SUB74009.1 Cellulose synthase regulatory subunit [Pluralibacter gergoviae]HDS1114969.1 cellulose biosynthesis cyclic di-GMP-binding re